MASSANPEYRIFISAAFDDKATIAVPLREKLQAQGLTVFTDERDILNREESPAATNAAMDSAPIGIMVMSPEFIERRQTMKELMCFLRRRKEVGEKAPFPVIIPLFYRLGRFDLYDEPRLDRIDKHDDPLYDMKELLERMNRKEPEASIAGIKIAMRDLFYYYGVDNKMDADNSDEEGMREKRETLIQEACDMVNQNLSGQTNYGYDNFR